MPEDVRFLIERLKEDIERLESLDSSYWNKSLGTNHLKSYAKIILNDADSISAYLTHF